ncbi:MAG: LacI family transcriptional regulator [Methanobacterium sp.]|nr:LacI family transcriptional regulator [Methanobacterium sp.]
MPAELARVSETAPRRARLEDIATRCGVSLSTVSRALSGEKGVSAELRAKIQETARAIRYAVPNEIAGSRIILAASRAAMIDYSRYQFSWYVLEGLQRRAGMTGIELSIQAIPESGIAPIIELVAEPSVGGLLILTVDDPAVLDAAAALSKPVVLVNCDDPLMRLSSVLPCNRSATRLATNYLVEHGHRDIAFLLNPGRRTIEQRLEGWRDAMRYHGLRCDDAMVVSVTDWLPELAEQAVIDHLRAGHPPFSALLCASDSLAIGAIEGVTKLGLKVPDDLSVIGMNNLPQVEFVDPPLTTMHLAVQEIGEVGLELGQEKMAGLSGTPRRIELASSLVERKSVAAVTR